MTDASPRPPMAMSRKQHALVVRTLDAWRSNGQLDEETAARLRASIAAAPFDWQRMARYAFIVAIACLLIAVGSALADRWLMQLLRELFNAPAAVKSAFFAVAAAGLFRLGLAWRRRRPARVYENEAAFFIGVLALAVSIYFLGVAIDSGSGHYSLLFLLASGVYAALGLWFPSALVWVFALLSLGTWMGTETGYASGYGAYFLGMNYPLRFVLFGGSLALLGILGEHHQAAPAAGATDAWSRLRAMSPQTKVVGLLHFFVALWIMSIFGNYGDMMKWEQAKQYELFHWSLLFGAAAIAAIWYGLRTDDGALRGFGLTFLCINLYTRFFEYFWDTIHKAAFFAILAASFWYLGTRAEKIWNLGRTGAGAPR